VFINCFQWYQHVLLQSTINCSQPHFEGDILRALLMMLFHCLDEGKKPLMLLIQSACLGIGPPSQKRLAQMQNGVYAADK
jgi:hypothetical protein